MGKTGVKVIAGKGEVQAGVWENYSVVEWYPETPEEERNEAAVKWEAYHLGEDGYDMILQKEQGNFRFLESGVGQEFLIVGYSHEPELNNNSAIKVKIVSGEKREILGIDMTDINDKPISGPLNYGKVVNVKTRTTGMVGETLNIDMWEDDAKGAGHSEENKYNKVDSKMAKVGAKGVAEKQFTIKPNFAKIAEAHNKQEGNTHEYYFTVYAGEVSNASGNVNVYTAEYKEKKDKEAQDEIAGKHPKVEPIKPVKRQPLAPPKKETPKTSEPKAT
uniref:hypothetical protein n=1 Tax=Flavobacterium sp. TaxID=239 RepID=UPI00286AA7BD